MQKWLEKPVELEWTLYKVGQERVGDSIRKISVLGSTRCIPCKTYFSYDKQGFTVLSDHMKSNNHKNSKKSTRRNIYMILTPDVL